MPATVLPLLVNCWGAPSRRTALLVSNTSWVGHQNRSSPEAEAVMVRMVGTSSALPFSISSVRLVLAAALDSSEAPSIMLSGAIT